MKLKQAVHVMRILIAIDITASIGVDGPEDDKNSYVVTVKDPRTGDVRDLSALEQVGAHIVAATRAGDGDAVTDPSLTPAMVDPELLP